MPITRQEIESNRLGKKFARDDAKPTAREALVYLLDALETSRLHRCIYCLATEAEIKQEQKTDLTCNHAIEDVYRRSDIKDALRVAKLALKR